LKAIYQYLRNHLAKVNILFLLGLGIFLTGSIYVRYFLKFDSYFIGQDWRVLKGMCFYAVPYVFAVSFACFFRKDWALFKSRSFWMVSLASLFVLVANQFLLFYKPFIRDEPLTYPFFRLFSFNLHTSFFYAIIPILFIWIGRKQENFGFTIKGFNYKPYLWMLAIMLPLLIWASFQPDFLRVYPRYKPGTAEEFWNISPFLTVGAFEFSYILQFIFLEWFFRGFMIMKLEKHLAHYAVFPMVAVYCFIHFGKPMAETVGSVFGGYILGVIALKSRTVFGGVLIHLGVALLMELLAFWQKI
jgi:hypothetical protein